jgi:hypothetical protein
MTTTTEPTRVGPVSTDFDRKTALVAGTFYRVTFAASIPALALLGPVLDDPNYIISAGSDTRVVLGCLLDVVNALACIGTAVALFPVLKRQNEAAALGFVTARMFEAAVIVIGVVSLLAVVTLRRDVAGAAGVDTQSLLITGRSLVAVRDWTFLLGPGFVPVLNALLLGSLLYRSRLVPRIIPTIGLLGAPVLLASSTATLFGVIEQVSVWSAVAALPIAAWELSVGMWMVVKGFSGPAAVCAPEAAESASSTPFPPA